MMTVFAIDLELCLLLGILANSLTWAFPPLQWIKRKIGVDDPSIEEEEELGERPRWRRIIQKPFNCDLCAGWWLGLFVSFGISWNALSVDPVRAWTAIVIYGMISSFISEALSRTFNR